MLTTQQYTHWKAKSIDVIPAVWDEVRVEAVVERKDIREWVNDVIVEAIARRRARRERFGERVAARGQGAHLPVPAAQ